MSVSIAQARRPLAMFRYSDTGQQIMVDIMQHGDKFSVVEKNADEWIAHISSEAIQGRYDATWLAQFKLEYEAFQKGNELPRDGTPIRTWAAISREQGTRLVQINITTVEDLASMPDSGIGGIGLDGRYLRDLAKNFLAQGQGTAAMSKKITELEASNKAKDEIIQTFEQRLAALETKKKAA